MSLPIIVVIKYWCQGEITNFIKVWLSVFASLFYSFFLIKIIPKGFQRLLPIIPVICLNLFLPLNLHTMHLCGLSSFFLAWLANFKLVLFAFGNGPLSDPLISFPKFVVLACFPIKSIPKVNTTLEKENHSSKTSKQGLKSLFNYVTKMLLIVLFLKLYKYTDTIHTKLTWVIYSLHIYLGLETTLAIVGYLAKTFVGIELEPQFDEPYLSSSLQEFWGKRWNIMVTRILHPTVYEPVKKLSSRVMGRKWAFLPSVLGCFTVSGLMHELIFFYLGRHRPSGELTLFFMLHGVCLAVEIVIKKAVNGRWKLPWFISGPLTIGFVMVTAFWLFFPEFLRCNSMARGFKEYEAMSAFVKDVTHALFRI